MNFPQKRKVNVAAASKRKHDLSHYHVGTTDFGRIKPIECRYMVPGDEFNYNIGCETRVLNAMPSPTIGQFDFVYRAFFVPIYNIWHPFYDFLKNQQTVKNGVLVYVDSAPYISLGDFLTYIRSHSTICEEVSNPSSLSEYDFDYQYIESQTTITKYYKFTRQGRILFDFLNSLGINIPLTASNSDITKLYIVLPLVCFWKFYFDWIVPSRFIHEHEDYIQLFIDKLHLNVGSKVSIDDFFKFLLHEPLAYFLDDYFTTCTEYPFSDVENMQDTIMLTGPSGESSAFVSAFGNNDDEEIFEYGTGSVAETLNGSFNMYTLQTLGKLQDLLNRNLIAGTKVQDWLLTEFGIKPNNDALHLSTYLGSKRNTLQVSDVISNADTEAQGGTPLGAYGGYINNRNQFDFSYKSQEHGFFFITCELVPRTSYYQGLAAQFDLGDRFDFFQPEFDNQQGAPISKKRLNFSQNLHTQHISSEIFGFSLQYGDLKFAPDVISGDFRNRFGLELKSWFLGRDLNYMTEDYENFDYINEDFCLVKSEYQDWHYIFNDTNDNLDPFLVAFYIQNHSMRPMKSITEGFEPTYQNSGKNVSLDFSGSVK